MIIDYARVSAQDQNPEFQVDALEKAGCEQIFQEQITGKLRERLELRQYGPAKLIVALYRLSIGAMHPSLNNLKSTDGPGSPVMSQ